MAPVPSTAATLTLPELRLVTPLFTNSALRVVIASSENGSFTLALTLSVAPLLTLIVGGGDPMDTTEPAAGESVVVPAPRFTVAALANVTLPDKTSVPDPALSNVAPLTTWKSVDTVAKFSDAMFSVPVPESTP